jgi:putative DNA primase/helicase
MAAETIARALGGRKTGQGWTARCPAHDDREPSLSIRDAHGKVLVRCHAGCSQRHVIAALKKRGLWGCAMCQSRCRASHRTVAGPQPDRPEAGGSAAALGIWQSIIPAKGAPIAIHRTFLARNGNGKAPVDPAKMMLGPCRGGAVRLADPGDC